MPDAFALATRVILGTPCPIKHTQGKNYAATAWQGAVALALQERGFEVTLEFTCPTTDGRGGRIDIVAAL